MACVSGYRDSTSSSCVSFAPLVIHITTCLMRSDVFPALPMFTTAGLRRYFLARRSTDGGIVALNMYVILYRVPAAPASNPPASIVSASSIGFKLSADMLSMTLMTCGSNPMSIIRSASSRTM
eukprot:31084-Pelagococcus_subviridis.AAC.8